MRCYLFNLFSKALFCIFGHANQSHIREWVAQKIISDFACIKCTIACRSWPLPSTYFFLYLLTTWARIFWKIKSLNFLSPEKLIQEELNNFNWPKYQFDQIAQLYFCVISPCERKFERIETISFSENPSLAITLFVFDCSCVSFIAQWKINSCKEQST